MEIEVGDYVRTKDGLVGKYYINKNSFNVIKINGKEIGFDIDKDIVKHSKNIIDLIEVGDILEIKTGLYSGFMEYIETDVDLEILSKQIEEYWHIKSILTHEQYEANCYKVEEKV